MIDLGLVQAWPTDFLRLLVVPVFAWAAWHDIQTRRLPNRLWPPLAAFGLVLLLWDGARYWGMGGLAWRQFAIGTAVSIGLVVPLVYGFWLLGGFGGADVKALAVLAVLFPVFPNYWLDGTTLPVVETTIGAFAFTILTNAVVVGICYPLALAALNVVDGEYSRWALVARRYRWSDLSTLHGRLLDGPDGVSRAGLDLDVLRMYLRWRGLDLEDVRNRADELRDPASLPETPNPPTDGAVTADGGELDDDFEVPDASDDDAWGAEAFRDSLGYDPYGTTPEQLRDGLEVIAGRDRVWVSPGIPFIVPVFVGLVVALVYGDLLFGVLRGFGLA